MISRLLKKFWMDEWKILIFFRWITFMYTSLTVKLHHIQKNNHFYLLASAIQTIMICIIPPSLTNMSKVLVWIFHIPSYFFIPPPPSLSLFLSLYHILISSLLEFKVFYFWRRFGLTRQWYEWNVLGIISQHRN